MTHTTRTVDSRTLSVGDVIIASPSAIGGRLKARVTHPSTSAPSFRAETVEVLEATSNGAEADRGRVGDNPYYYSHGPVELVVVEWTPVQVDEIQPGDYIRGTWTADHTCPNAQVVEGQFERVAGAVSQTIRIVDQEHGYSLRNRTWEKRVDPAPQWSAVNPSDMRPGDYVRGTQIEGQFFGREGEEITVEGTFAELKSTGSVRLTSGQRGYHPVNRAWERRTGADTPAPSPEVTWTRVQQGDLSVGDYVRTRRDTVPSDRNWDWEGPVTRIEDEYIWVEGARDGNCIDMDFNVVERRSSASTPPTPAPTHYPTIHHLKAALFDVLHDNYTSGVWCSSTNRFARDMGLEIPGLDATGLDQHQATTVAPYIARLQGEAAQGYTVSSGSIDQAFERLGIPRTATPTTKRLSLEIEAPVGLTEQQIREMIASRPEIRLHSSREV